MNRQQRRAQAKAQKRQQKAPKPKYQSMTKEQRIEALVKNGITPKDLEKNFADGYDEGYKDASTQAVKTVYAAVCLALHDKPYGFERERCADVLRAVENHVLYSLSSEEAIEEVYKRMKLQLDFGEPFDRIIELE